MPISLKHINTSDSDNTKLDKVNYNFDQLVANGGGPAGPQGPIGQTGPQGTSGQQGFQGSSGTTGFQGPVGPVSDNYWRRISSGAISVDTLLPIHNVTNQFAPVVNIGYIENDAEYGTKSSLIAGKTPYQWKIHRKQYSNYNLSFLNSNLAGNSYNFRLEKLGGKDQMTMGFLKIENSLSIYRSAGISFRSSATSQDNLLIDATGTYFKKPTVFNSSAAITSQLIIENANADTDKIAISNDATGLVKFKGVQELGGTVPFGTIVSILPSIFADSNKFINTESTTEGDTEAIHISVGKGINNYEGWYLCHGKQWTNGVDTYQVPMLGNFNYNIEDNPWTLDVNSQGGALTSNYRTHITGGSDIGMTATAVPVLTYNITSTIDISTVNLNPGEGTTFKIKQLPQIIYLGKTDLYWFDQGGDQAPAVLNTYRFIDGDGTIDTIDAQRTFMQGGSYTFTQVISAPAGYYFTLLPNFVSQDITKYTIASVTLGAGTFPTTVSVLVNVLEQGPANSIRIIDYNTNTFVIPIPVASHTYTLVDEPSFTAKVLGSGLHTQTSPSTTLIGGTYSFTIKVEPKAGYTISQFDVDSGNPARIRLDSTTPNRITLATVLYVDEYQVVYNITDTNCPASGSTTIEFLGVITAIIAGVELSGSDTLGDSYSTPYINDSFGYSAWNYPAEYRNTTINVTGLDPIQVRGKIVRGPNIEGYQTNFYIVPTPGTGASVSSGSYPVTFIEYNGNTVQGMQCSGSATGTPMGANYSLTHLYLTPGSYTVYFSDFVLSAGINSVTATYESSMEWYDVDNLTWNTIY